MSRGWMAHSAARRDVGPLLRDWRQRRKLSQMALALDVGVSPRHLSFVETGSSRPSAELLLSMSEHLAVPLRQLDIGLRGIVYSLYYANQCGEDGQGTVFAAMDYQLHCTADY